jgi:bacterioferritin-associated ferredoxin
MIVCHCNRIDHRDIEGAADQLSGVDDLDLVTPVAVYKTLGKTPRCGGCLSLAASIIHARNVCRRASDRLCPFSYDQNDPAPLTGERNGQQTSLFLMAAD